jgi:hypothetical protein
MTPEEFTQKLQEFRATVSEKSTELEEDPNWGSADERVEIVHELEELVVQLEALIETLEQDPEDPEEGQE